jgi:hypothetical protein
MSLIALVVLVGCRQLFGIDDTAVAADAGAGGSDADLPVADAAEDAPPAPDAALAMCGAAYAPLAGGSPSEATYRGVEARRPWMEARSACQTDGADLVVVDDATEAEAVAALVQDATSPYFWVGVFQPSGPGVDPWETVRGGLATYLPWAPGQPTGGPEMCALFGDLGAPHELYDFNCAGTQYFVCECLP